MPSCFSKDSLQSRCTKPNFENSDRISPLILLLTLKSLDISLTEAAGGWRFFFGGKCGERVGFYVFLVIFVD
jgi:hypothetical protein